MVYKTLLELLICYLPDLFSSYPPCSLCSSHTHLAIPWTWHSCSQRRSMPWLFYLPRMLFAWMLTWFYSLSSLYSHITFWPPYLKCTLITLLTIRILISLPTHSISQFLLLCFTFCFSNTYHLRLVIFFTCLCLLFIINIPLLLACNLHKGSDIVWCTHTSQELEILPGTW